MIDEHPVSFEDELDFLNCRLQNIIQVEGGAHLLGELFKQVLLRNLLLQLRFDLFEGRNVVLDTKVVGKLAATVKNG